MINSCKTYAYVIPLFTLCATDVTAELNAPKGLIKEPNVKGLWYPAKKSALKETVKKLAVKAREQYGMHHKTNKIRAVVVPHAGFDYSGHVAAAVFRLVKKQRFDRVIILGPSHFVSFQGIATPHFHYYRIPFGLLKVDDKTLNDLKRLTLFHEQPGAFTPEHSLEATLPFIDYFTHHTPIIPLVVGELTDQEITRVAQALLHIITPKTLVVISTDMMHYGASFHYRPFKKHILWNIHHVDASLLAALQHQDRVQFSRTLNKTHATVCGKVPLKILLELLALNAFGPCTVRCIAYDTSLHTHETLTISDTSQPTTVVSYAGLIVTQAPADTTVGTFDQRSLLNYARNILLHEFRPASIPAKLFEPIITPALEQQPGVFVTLYTKTQDAKTLRGCIGTITGTQPLYKGVADMARAAAFRDPRFPPLTEQELASLLIEISILQPPHAVASYQDIILNKHGIILTVKEKSALFLPKVPQEFGFTLEQTLTELSRKAGLPDDAWQLPEAQFQVFETLDF